VVDDTEARGASDFEARPALRVIVAEDDPFARTAIKDALQRANISVVGEAQNGRQAVELVLQQRPDAVLMDVVMPELDGLTATRYIVNENPDQIVILVTRGDDEVMGIESLRAGAAGFLANALDVDALPRAVRGAVKGEAAISRRLAMCLVERFRGRPARTTASQPLRSPLTAREWEVIALLEEGKTTEEIGEELVLAKQTVRSHITHILRKLDVRSRSEAVAAAQRIRGAKT
jgi:DNA-binding NarL/FixJ family response regulator